MPSTLRTTRLFHQNVITRPMEQVADHCIQLIEARQHTRGRPALVFAMNPEKSMQSYRDPDIRQLLQQSDILIPDGIGTCIGARLLNGVRMQRVPGSELMPELCSRAEREGLSIYLYGASPDSNAGALATIRATWPRLRIAGASHGFMPPGTPDDIAHPDQPDAAETVAVRIARARPDIVFVGLGSPRQERWMAEVGSQLPVGLLQGVGGTIDVLSGTATRAPRFWRRIGLEWLYRLMENPKRWRRQLALPRYMSLVLRLWLFSHLPSPSNSGK
ncbi:MAG: WecB/TagA/CpsF family glycosyltransferase [Lautropia sp.]|nr:WecB/TagA/CpsF family glycosyltransferase [Lautropia sp.]